jgi:hypothetical protein
VKDKFDSGLLFRIVLIPMDHYISRVD